ncbi:unnamed protein product [Caenorhabditis angaria]|uniref:Uncharacterized protein n=1 Tax=Caenorhabditis angaria TaxID=860376 RepID=A0A9P1MXM1_9PELO|nr:unnamed protein product [Caenorhabditis angaria]
MSSALVIGATSTLGKAVVRRLAFAGYKVAATGDCPNTIGKIAEDNKKVGGNVTAYSLDTSNAAHRAELISKVAEQFSGLDTLIFVPPQNTVIGDILDSKSEDFDKIFGEKLTIPFRFSQDAMGELKKSRNGSIILLTSCLGLQPSVDLGLYSVASSSVLSLTKALAVSAAKNGVRVNSVVTGMVEGDGSSSVWDNTSGEEATRIKQQLEAMIPLGRLGRPSDVASYVEFLASDKARYITGENCVVNGGVSYRF